MLWVKSMLLQILEPTSPAVGIDLGTTHSLVAIADQEGIRFLTDLIPSEIHHVRSFKRFMPQPEVLISSDQTALTLSYHFLSFLKEKAEKNLHQPITKAVITVPAHFDDAARQATKEAARLAGIDVLRLIHEPTAAALAYDVSDGFYLVYDFGGGTFDVSLLYREGHIFQVIKTAGDLYLGGDDIDESLYKNLNLGNLQEAKSLKEKGGEIVNFYAQPFIDKTIQLCTDVMLDMTSPLSGILLVGGSSRLENVALCLEKTFGIKPLCTKNPEYVVAEGAALQAKALTQPADHLLLDVTPLSLGIETAGGLVNKIIPRNTPIPTQAFEEFTTFQDGQTKIKIHVLQGEGEFVNQCRSLAEFTLENVPPMPAGLARLKITFHIDADGILSVTAEEMHTQVKQTISVQARHELKEEDLKRLLKTSSEDIKKRILEDMRLKAQQLIHNLQKSKIDELAEEIENLKIMMQGDDLKIIQDQMDDLVTIAQPILEKRMVESFQAIEK
jgi:molecular chaperone HscA